MPIGLIIAISVGAGMAIGSALTNFFSKDEKVTMYHREWGEMSSAQFSPAKFKKSEFVPLGPKVETKTQHPPGCSGVSNQPPPVTFIGKGGWP